jgi:hypothetical protein
VGDGFVFAEHGRMPVPAPATARLLEGLAVSPGPAGSGELTTPTGAVLVRVLSSGGVPPVYVTRRVGYGAGTKDFQDRPNVLRISLADPTGVAAGHEQLVLLTADIDDGTPEHLAAAAEFLRQSGALDVTISPVVMKKGRLGSRLDVLATPGDAERLESAVLLHTPTIGVRRAQVLRRALGRRSVAVQVLGQTIALKVVELPDGGVRIKPELDDLNVAALATGRPIAELSALAVTAARAVTNGV